MSPPRHPVLAHVLRTVPLLAWCALVWTLSDRPDPGRTIGVLAELPDWLLHGAEYAAGGFLACVAFGPLSRGRGTALAVAFCVVWALLDELHQSFVPGRDSSWRDVLADVVGASVGVALHVVWTRRRAV